MRPNPESCTSAQETKRVAWRELRKPPEDYAFRIGAWVDSSHRPQAYQAASPETEFRHLPNASRP